MSRMMLGSLLGLLLILLFAAVFASVCAVLHAITRRKRRFNWKSVGSAVTENRPPSWLLRACFIQLGDGDGWAEWEQLMAAAGIRLEPLWYICFKRLSLAALWSACVLTWVYRLPLERVLSFPPWLVSAAAGGLVLGSCVDRYLLESMKKYRTHRIVEEIFAVSRQLLYFAGSPMNLHGKLARCLPYTRLIRQEWHLLLNDWYQDSEGAINGLRRRLGTEEAYGFSETLQALRLNDGEDYYELLRQRVQDYKEKLELIRDSRKESVSYVLFVLAGIPIMYTFQIFLHPWVQEGKRLFEGLR